MILCRRCRLSSVHQLAFEFNKHISCYPNSLHLLPTVPVQVVPHSPVPIRTLINCLVFEIICFCCLQNLKRTKFKYSNVTFGNKYKAVVVKRLFHRGAICHTKSSRSKLTGHMGVGITRATMTQQLVGTDAGPTTYVLDPSALRGAGCTTNRSMKCRHETQSHRQTQDQQGSRKWRRAFHPISNARYCR